MRTCIEATVLVTGWLLGGTVGIGTVLYALSIGPIMHQTVPAFSVDRRRAGAALRPEPDEAPSSGAMLAPAERGS